MRLSFLMPLVAIGFTAMSTLAHAQEAGAEAGTLQQELQKQVPQLQPLPKPAAPVAKPKPQEAKPSEVKVTIKGFRIDGNKTLSDEAIKETLKPWLGKTVAFQELQKAADSVAALYQTQGKLAQVSVPPQKINDGIVILKVLEATLGAVHIDMPNGPSRFGEDKARRYVTDANRLSEIVQTRNIERSIYILNETPGIAVTSQLEQGQNEGEVDIRLNLSDTKLTRGRVEANNFGSRSTGIAQAIGSLFVDGLLGIGDQLALSGVKSEGSTYRLASISVPLNTDSLRLGMSVSQLQYANINQFAYPQNVGGAKGEATTVGLSLTHALKRSAASNSNISFGLDRKRYANQQQFDSSYTSQYQIRNIVIGYTANRYDALWGGGVTQGGINLTRGRIEFGNQNPRNSSGELIYGKNTPSLFTKINFNISRNQQLVPDQTILNIAFNGQLASDDLDPAERFYLGGPNGVRGYPGSQGSGSQGAMVNIELQQSLEDKFIGSIFFDAGVVQQYKDKNVYITNKQRTGADNVYALSSVGLGLKRQDKGIVWSTTIAWRLGHNPLLDSQGNRVNNDSRYKKPFIWAQVQWMF